MSTPITADQLLAQLKKWKVPYREIDGWRTRGRDEHTGLTFGPVFGCVTHHTGDDAPDVADRNVIINGRPDLPGPLAQFGLNDDGVVDIISVHRCNHAGGGDPRVLEVVKAESYGDYPPAPHEHQGSAGAVDGNDCFYGVEAYYSGKMAPTAKAYRSIVLLWAALCEFHGWTAKSVIGHKEWSDWKIDPGHVDMKVLRADIQKALDEAAKPTPALRFTSANLDFVRGHDADYLAHLCEGADVLLVQEAKNVRLADVLPEGWTALQDTTSEATMGSAIAYRNETVRAGSRALTLIVGSTPFWQGRRVQMLTRFIATAHLQDRATGGWLYAVAAHLPPKRFRFLQPGMVHRLRKVVKGHPHAVIGLDANQPLDRLATKLGLQSFGEGIVGVLVGPGLHFGKGSVDPWGVEHQLTDHPAVTVRVRKRSES